MKINILVVVLSFLCPGLSTQNESMDLRKVKTAVEHEDSFIHLVVTLGEDTVGIEKYSINKNEIVIEAIRRVNSVTKEMVELSYRVDGSILEMVTKTYNTSDSLLGLFTIKSEGDSLYYLWDGSGEKNTWTQHGRPHLLGMQIPYYATYAKFIKNYKQAPECTFEFYAFKSEPIQVGKIDEETYKLSTEIAGGIRVSMNMNEELEAVKTLGTGLLSYEASRVSKALYDKIAREWLKNPKTKIISTISPRIKDTFDIQGTKISLDYGRTSKRGRKIFGGLVPYNKVWRTGSNLATHITFEDALTIEGHRIPKGTYTLYTIPNVDQWTLLFNKETGQWGAYYDESQELLRLPMQIKSMEESVEALEISVETVKDGGELIIRWDDVEAKIKFKIED